MQAFTELLAQWFGSAASGQIIIAFSSLLEQIIGAFCFNIFLKKNKRFYFSYFIFFIMVFFLSLVDGALRVWTNDYPLLKGVLHAIFITAFLFALIFISSKKDFYDKLLSFASTNAAIVLTGKLFSLMINACGVDDQANITMFVNLDTNIQWLIYLLAHIVITLILGFVFNRKDQELLKTGATKKSIAILATFSSVFTILLFTLSRPYESESMALTILIKLFGAILCFIVLFMKTNILLVSKKEQENLIMNELFRQEKTQFDALKTNIDIINNKCHDLRHQLTQFQGRITDEEVNQLKEATRIYDNTIKTGYEVLDAIIYEKQLLCEKNHIRFSIIADGRALTFMDTTHLYSLLSNLLSNAIEASTKLPDDRRVIDLSVRRSRGMVLLEVSNFYNGNLVFTKEGTPVSSKIDGHPHGYGTKSIAYIVNQYHGEIQYRTKDNIYRVLIGFEDREETDPSSEEKKR